MNHRERFARLFNFEPIDRMPIYFFGTWPETRARWAAEGLTGADDAGGSGGPQLPQMDPDWEGCFWNSQHLATPLPLADRPDETVEETDDYRIVRTGVGGLVKHSKRGSTPPLHIEHALKPTRADWRRFKRFLDPHDPRRRPADWIARAEALNRREHVTCFLAGSLFGFVRDWMGVEPLVLLAYDDPVLFEEIIDYLVDYYLALTEPMLERCSFDVGYIHEDCCFNTGPLLSPSMYRRFYDRHYRRLIDAYRRRGVPLILMDSDGKIDDLLPLWIDSGVDILFPIEVGTWGAGPVDLRRRFGDRLRMMGGVDKHVIPRGEAAIRDHLESLRPAVDQGGYLPMPDHRIPPHCSLEQFRTYLHVFKALFCQ